MCITWLSATRLVHGDAGLRGLVLSEMGRDSLVSDQFLCIIPIFTLMYEGFIVCNFEDFKMEIAYTSYLP